MLLSMFFVPRFTFHVVGCPLFTSKFNDSVFSEKFAPFAFQGFVGSLFAFEGEPVAVVVENAGDVGQGASQVLRDHPSGFLSQPQ